MENINLLRKRSVKFLLLEYYQYQSYGARPEIEESLWCEEHLLTPWSRVLLEKLTGSAASQEILRILWKTF